MKQNTPQPSDTKHSEEESVETLLKGKKPHWLGWLTIFLIFGVFGVWSAVVEIDTTVPANGKVISKGYKKMVQHPRGGRVTELYVKEGDRVKKGDPLLALDSVASRSQLRSSIRQADELIVQRTRLEAEAEGKTPDFAAAARQLYRPEEKELLVARERAIYESDVKKLELGVRQLENKNKILREQNRALEARIASNEKMVASYEKELQKWRTLYDQNMTDELKLLERQRKIEQIRSDIVQARSKIAENMATIEANRNQVRLERNRFVNEARHRLKEVGIKLETLREKIVSLKNDVENAVVKSPDDGTVTDLAVHSPGEVIPPNKPIAYIVPNEGNILLEAYVAPTDIDKIHVGQLADIHFPSYVDPSSVPVEGKITYVSADTVIPEGAREPFYKIYIEITPKGEEAIRKNGFKIVPGMPISAFVKSGKRSFMSYFLLPLQQLMKGAFHDN